MKVQHDKENQRFTMDINGDTAQVIYKMDNGKMYLTYSEVPSHLRGKGHGKKLVEKTFAKLMEEGYTAVAVCAYIKAVARRSEKWNSIIE